MPKTDRKIVAVDFDDVVLNFNGTFVPWHNRRFGTAVTYVGFKSHFLPDVFGEALPVMQARVSEFYNSSEHKAALPISGAPEALQRLGERFSLQIVTSRPSTTESGLREWLEKNGVTVIEDIRFTGQFISSGAGKDSTKAAICQEIGAQVFIEDSLSHALDVSKVGVPVLLPDRPWNQAELPLLVRRVTGWSEIVRLIEAKA